MYQMKRTPLSIIDDAFHRSLSSDPHCQNLRVEKSHGWIPTRKSDNHPGPCSRLEPDKNIRPAPSCPKFWCISILSSSPTFLNSITHRPIFIILSILRQINSQGNQRFPLGHRIGRITPSAPLTLPEIGLSSIASCRPRSFVSSCPVIANGGRIK